MSTTITLVVVVAFSFVVGEFIQRLATRRGLLLSGAEYLIVGVLVGPLASGVVSTDSLMVIEPAMWLLIGLIGFRMGLRLRHAVSAGGAAYLIAASLLSLLSMTAIGAAGLGVLLWMEPDSALSDLILPTVVFGTAGSVVSSRFAAERFRARGPLTRFLSTSADWGNTLAVLVAGGVMDWQQSKSPIEVLEVSLPGELWSGASLLIGVFAGVLFWLFHRDEDSDERTFLATVGVVIFASGIASAVGCSPLLVGLLAGVTVSVLSRQADDLSDKLSALQRPSGIVLMIFAGTLWVLPTVVGWAGVLTYLVTRTVVLWVLPRLVVRPLLQSDAAGWLGTGMRGQGVVPVALVLSLVLVHEEHAQVMSVVLVCVFVLEFGAGNALRRLLGDAGELGVVHEPASHAGGAA
jgi:Kef-type K+ transport system membrane component KefB